MINSSPPGRTLILAQLTEIEAVKERLAG